MLLCPDPASVLPALHYVLQSQQASCEVSIKSGSVRTAELPAPDLGGLWAAVTDARLLLLHMSFLHRATSSRCSICCSCLLLHEAGRLMRSDSSCSSCGCPGDLQVIAHCLQGCRCRDQMLQKLHLAVRPCESAWLYAAPATEQRADPNLALYCQTDLSDRSV